jgi:hypothetical protein
VPLFVLTDGQGQEMVLSIADFDVSITPSFSKAGKTASSSAVIRNVVKMAISAKNSEIKRQQKDLGRGRTFEGMIFVESLCARNQLRV